MTTNTRASGTNTRGATGTGQGTGQMGTSSTLARGGSILAASLLFLLGVYHFFAGIAGFARANFYTVGSNYPYRVSSNSWGWIYVIGGVLLVLTSLGLFSRSTTWARPVAIALAVLSVIANFFFLVYFPLWAVAMIALAIFCIWALAREGQDQRAQEMERGQQQYAMQQYGQPQAGMGTQQNIGAYGAGQGQRQQAGTGAYVSSGAQSGQRWPENAGGSDESQRGMSSSDMKDSASRTGGQAQQNVQSGARGGQSGRNPSDEASNRGRQSGQ
jgi:hypothetical protein